MKSRLEVIYKRWRNHIICAGLQDSFVRLISEVEIRNHDTLPAIRQLKGSDDISRLRNYYCYPRLNVYKYMIETEYGLRVSSMYLGQVHPCLARARLIEVPCMQKEELELIVEDQIDRGEAISGALPDARFALPPAKTAPCRWCPRVRVCHR